MMEESATIPGEVTAEPDVLEIIAWHSAIEVPGVVQMERDAVEEFFSGKPVSIIVENGQVTVDLHIMAAPDQSLLKLGRKVQYEVTRAIQNMIGMPVAACHVHIEDVIYPQKESPEK